MLDRRTLALGAVVFCATFVGGWWLGLGNLPLPWGMPGALASVQPAADARPAAVQNKGLTENEALRQAVVLRAKAYLRPYCNQDPRSLYVSAATQYAEVLMRAAGCHNFPKCPMSESQLDRVWQAKRSERDLPVAQAMAEVHDAGGLSARDFRGDVGRAVRVIAGTEFRLALGPECVNASSRASSSWRIRVRR